MIKLMIVGRRAAGRTHKGAIGHLRDIHAKMVVCPPDDSGPMPADYVQNHVIDGAYPATGTHAIERDLVTELWFDSIDHLRASTGTPYYLSQLKPDEPRFVDDDSVAKLMVAPGAPHGTGKGDFKAFVFIARGAADDATWTDARQSALAAFLASPGLVAAVENDVLAPPDGAVRFADVVLEGWYTTRDAAIAAVDGRAAFGDAAIDRNRCFAVAAEHYDRDRLRAGFGA